MEKVTEEQLESLTNQEEGFQTTQVEEPPQEQGQSEESKVPVEKLPPTESDKGTQQSKPEKPSINLDGLRESFKETPFTPDDLDKAVKDVIKSWKSTDSEYKKLSNKVKPYQQLIDKALTDPQVHQAIEMLDQFIKNPQMAQLYANPNASSQPDPRNYDLSTVEGYNSFRKDESLWMQKQSMDTINSRLAEVEARNIRERQKLEFRQKYPEIQDDLDVILAEVMQKQAEINPYEIAYRYKNWDSRESQIAEKLRSQIINKANEASAGKTPQTSVSKKGEVSAQEIANYVVRYGSKTAEKKFGKEAVERSVRAVTRE